MTKVYIKVRVGVRKIYYEKINRKNIEWSIFVKITSLHSYSRNISKTYNRMVFIEVISRCEFTRLILHPRRAAEDLFDHFGDC